MAVQRELGGPSLPQERRLVTSVPGPRSLQLQARRDATVARGVGATLPVFVDRAGGGSHLIAGGLHTGELGTPGDHSGVASPVRFQLS